MVFMARKIKLKNETYIDSSSVMHNRSSLSNVFNNNLKGANGYLETPSGFLIQWGTANGTGYKNFPKPFTNGCLFVICDGAWANVNPSYKTLSGITNWDKNGFTLGSFGYMKVGEYGESISTQSYRSFTGIANFAGITRWLAIGY